MGEWSKKIGEVGEKIVGEFFELIGWSDSQCNLTLPCIKKIRHGDNGKQKNTHGIDYLFSYETQLSSRTLDHLVISVKYTLNAYPSAPSGKFKEHFIDLAKTLECFKSSKIRSICNKNFSNIDQARDIGVLFWLTNDINSDQDVIHKITKVRGINDYNYGTIYIVDNKRVSFIYDTIKYLKLYKSESDIEYSYPNTGKNYDPTTREMSGKILPVEYINSSVLPLTLKDKNGIKTFAISVIDDFSKERLKRLIGLSQEMTRNFAYDILILFPDYDQIHHQNYVNEIKSGFKDKKFTETVKVSCFRDDFRRSSNE